MPEQYIEALVADQAAWVGGINPPLAVRWNAPAALGTPAAVTYSFLTASAGSLDAHISAGDSNGYQPFTAGQMAAARAVLQLYSDIANLSFSELVDPTGASAQMLFAQNTQGGSAGYAYMPIHNSTADAGDIWLAGNAPSNGNMTPGGAGFTTLLHEIGHALGLQHSFGPPDDALFATSPLPLQTQNQQYTVMSYTQHPKNLFLDVADGIAPPDLEFSDFHYSSISPSTPMLYDIAAIQYLYGANTAHEAGDTTYTFDPHAPFYECIWDAGGIDTISVANFTRGCEIDLRPGEFSNIVIPTDPVPPGWVATPGTYDGTDNLSIAFGSIIERAIGGAGNDTLTGNDADNVLTGGGGADVLTGGLGNDTFVIDAADQVIELAGEGIDTIWSATTYSLAGLPQIENLLLLAGAALNATGNEAANILTGNENRNVLFGGGGNDQLDGAASGGSFVSRRGNTLTGGSGDDLYIVTSLDQAWEAANEGNDTVQAAQSYRLGANLENLVFTGIAHASGTGNELANSIAGNVGSNWLSGLGGNDSLIGGAGNDTLNGGAGSDWLSGGAGADRFVFDSSASGADSISDFDFLDQIWLDEDAYTAFGQTDAPRALSSASFWAGSGAHDADDRILYDRADGSLRYDSDGSGAAASVLIATLGTSFHPQLTFAEFQIIA